MGRDIIVHYDAEAGTIICSTVEQTLTAPLRAKALLLETSVEAFKARGADEAERTLGAGIFALLDLSCTPKIGIRDYKSDTSKWEAEHTEELEQKSINGDGAAQFDLAMEKITKGLRTKSKQLMNEADVLLLSAANAKHAEAMEYLANLWPALKSRSDEIFE